MRYLEIQLLLGVAFGLWLGLRRWALREGAPATLLRLAHLLLAAALSLPFIAALLPGRALVEPRLEIWAAPTFRADAAGFGARAAGYVALGAAPTRAAWSWARLGELETAALALFATGALVALARLVTDARRLRSVVRAAHLVRRIGRVELRVSEDEAVAFSCWTPWRAYVILPESLIGDRAQWRIAVLHELQHHRQGDTRWVHLFQAIKIGFFWNPFVHLWERSVSLIQEFACDEALVGRKGVSAHAYGSCLIQAAEQSLSVLGSRRRPAGTAGMATGISGETLKRRIDMMFGYSKRGSGRALSGLLGGTLALILLGATALASQGIVRDRRISLAEAQQMAHAAAQGGSFPIVVNDAVLEQLNRFLGTPDGRAYMRGALDRMRGYRPMIEAKLLDYVLPQELLAIPVIESAYRNEKFRHAAGLWSFIPQTARNFNLRVNDQVDDRLDAGLETDAAMRLLAADYLRFQDWWLALLAYNGGESLVQRGIDATGSRDAWKLVASGYQGDRGYIAEVMAAILILKNPSVLN